MSALLHAELPELGQPKQGKVRELYDLGDQLLIVATDRLSAFDVVLPCGIPDKGRVLTQLSAFWFEKLVAVCPNHLVNAEDSQVKVAIKGWHEGLKGRCSLVKKTKPLPVECVARGYLTGSLYKEYQFNGKQVHGLVLPEGLLDGSKLPEPIFSPATKAEHGHDENISFNQMVDRVGIDVARNLREWTLSLYQEASRHSLNCGLILADTKFEFGLHDEEGLLWIDEALTPDSSRYWESTLWKPGGPQPSFDKQFVRDYLEHIGWNKQPPAPDLPAEIVEKTRSKYLEAFRRLTGEELAL